MDMAPPQAPPAIEAPAQQAAVAAYQSLVATHDWLTRQLAALPPAPVKPDAAHREQFLRTFDTYWDTARRDALASRVATSLRDLARLGEEDRVLDTRSATLAGAVARAYGGALPPGVTVRDLRFGPIVLGGALVVESSADRRTLLFSADGGWEVFGDLDTLHESVGQRIRRRLADGAPLPGAARRGLGDVGLSSVSSQPIDGDPFTSYVNRAIEVHREKLDEAWVAWAIAEGEPARDTVLADTLTRVLAWIPALDVEALLATRNARLVESINEERLADVPADVATHWRHAADTYAVALKSASDSDAPVTSLAAFATEAVSSRLKALGIHEAPINIRIKADYNGDAAVRAQSLQSLFEGTAPVYIGLLDLVYQNIAVLDPVKLTAVDVESNAIRALDDRAIRRLVRELDLATRYHAYLTGVLRHGEPAAGKKKAATLVLAARMRMQAADARLSYYRPSEPRSFRDDHAERGFQWIRAVLNAPTSRGREKVEGHDVVAYQVTYQGTPLKDVLAFGVRQPGAVPTILYYTPDAPDGMVFREFDDRGEAARRFLYHPAFREYLLDRLPMEYATVTPGREDRQFAGSRLASWVLGAASDAAYTWTAAPFEERAIEGDVLDAAYETGVQLALRNVTAFSRSASDANWAWLVDWPRRLLLDNLVANAIKGIANAPMHAAQASWRLYDSIKAGDAAQAYLDFTDFYVASLGAAAPGVVGGSARGIVAANFRQGARLVGGSPSRALPVQFEPRYEATGVVRRGASDANGMWLIENQHYIEQGGKLYGVRYDASFDTWRLKPHQGGATTWGPAVQRTESAAWAYNVIGLRGGSGRGARRAAGQQPSADDWFNHYADAIERAFPDAFERELVARSMESEMIGIPPVARIDPIQRARWIEARSNALSAQGFADWRQQWMAPPQAAAEGLVTPKTPAAPLLPALSPPFRRIHPSQVPEELYYYGNLPYGTSQFQRELTRGGYNTNWAHLHGERLGQDLVAVPVTTVPPNASIADIRASTGNRTLVRSGTFGVRIQPRGLLAPGLSGPRAELIAIDSASGTRYYLRPTAGENFLRLGANQRVVSLGREP